VSAQPTTLPTSACSGQTATGSFTVSIRSDGVHRTVLVHLPSGFTDRTRVALVLNMHGSGSTAAKQAAFSGMNAVADRDGFIVAYPQGAIASGSGDDWNAVSSSNALNLDRDRMRRAFNRRSVRSCHERSPSIGTMPFTMVSESAPTHVALEGSLTSSERG
jgi:poly(3-hydroxybutyrate) depolymerase